MKQCFKKLEDPHFKKPPLDRHTRKVRWPHPRLACSSSYSLTCVRTVADLDHHQIRPSDRPGYLQGVASAGRLESEKQELLQAKRSILQGAPRP